MQKPEDIISLVHWTYSREEWKTFMRWEKMKKGLFHYILHCLSFSKKARTPEITITQSRVSIDDTHEPFDGKERRFKRINIRDAGNINVMEIFYQHSDTHHTGLGEIHIPVPRGRLKEAIGVEEKLNAIKDANPPG